MKILSLYDRTGIMVKPWLDAGHEVLTVDIKEAHPFNEAPHKVMDLFHRLNISWLIQWKPDLVFSFTDCTDLAVSGAAHFEKKRKKNPRFQKEAMDLFMVGPEIADECDVPYMVENPVSCAATLWRKPDYYFDPHHYGGYLPEDDVHPLWPEYIAPRDAYPKYTCIWAGNGFVMPQRKPVNCPPGYSDQNNKLGGKSERTKMIRSATPRGFTQGAFEANERDI